MELGSCGIMSLLEVVLSIYKGDKVLTIHTLYYVRNLLNPIK